MTTDDLIKHFGTTKKIADFFGITREAFYLWKKRPNKIIPKGRAAEAVLGTNGAIFYDPGCYKEKNKQQKMLSCENNEERKTTNL